MGNEFALSKEYLKKENPGIEKSKLKKMIDGISMVNCIICTFYTVEKYSKLFFLNEEAAK